MPECSVPGKPIPRIDEGAPEAKGEARFSVDVMLPGMLYGGILQGIQAFREESDGRRYIKAQGLSPAGAASGSHGAALHNEG